MQPGDFRIDDAVEFLGQIVIDFIGFRADACLIISSISRTLKSLKKAAFIQESAAARCKFSLFEFRYEVFALQWAIALSIAAE